MLNFVSRVMGYLHILVGYLPLRHLQLGTAGLLALGGMGGLISVYIPRMEHWDSSIKCDTSKVNVYAKKACIFLLGLDIRQRLQAVGRISPHPSEINVDLCLGQ